MYTLLQIPAALLVALLLWWARIKAGLDLWLAWTILAAWVAKDVVLFFFLWPAYDQHQDDYYSLSGLSGTALDTLDPEGTVRVRGQTWKARSSTTQTIPPGCPVRVEDRQGLTLMVRPDEAPQ
jgi:membrane-bound serine protease (ClpP class)